MTEDAEDYISKIKDLEVPKAHDASFAKWKAAEKKVVSANERCDTMERMFKAERDARISAENQRDTMRDRCVQIAEECGNTGHYAAQRIRDET